MYSWPMNKAVTELALVLTIGTIAVGAWPEVQHGWKIYGADGGCEGVEKVDIAQLSALRFEKEYAREKPVVIVGLGLERNAAFRELCQRERILADWGDSNITLSTANTRSYQKRRATLRTYIEEIVDGPEFDAGARGSDTWYWFGDNDHAQWSTFFDKYILPPFAEADKVALSFGIGTRFSGVPFHIHGRVFAETIVGRKRWLLFPPDHCPDFDGNQATLSWLAHNADLPGLLDCTVYTGEILYIPPDWYHATLNLDQTVFISSFIDDQSSSLHLELR
eukprot:Plantae.Rhodophyta-Purpureofilum_apyrenoidigerum.ctg19721.p1 GENE.Plantae.Rhodophyta-Purpureofilum_apyrenoidigerum.ctg19721~~Plantae.Rhodophyta-Purpureofilum_apyrenoidigerum.ctg19721.p1  ORF type:complete len:278 (-),score=40.39 Plantae.Rhodophyta-Purpureofilum_apyrenoidigerum.ctg19721:79-912(-)